MNRHEPHLVANPVVAHNFGDRQVTVGAEPLGDLRHGGRYIKMKRGAQPTVGRPLGQRLEVIHRLDRFDLNNRLDLAGPVQRSQDDIGEHRGWAGAHRGVLLHARVDPDVETTAKPGLQKANDPVVLELLPDWPDEDGAHESATITWMPPL